MFDVIIVGGGIVGLATAYQTLLKKPGLKVAIVEKEPEVAQHQTGNNSGVIHSGIYYKPGSEKALNCKRGYKLLLDFINTHNINYELCGKIIVATKKSEIPNLKKIYERGIENGLKGLKWLTQEETKEIEPHVNAINSIYVPQAGIIDYKQVALKLKELILELGGNIFLNQKIQKLENDNNICKLITSSGKEFLSKYVVNCSGLQSDEIAEQHFKTNLRIIPFRGEYYMLNKDKSYLVKSLIYPVPNPNLPFLGVHFTKMINGKIEAGPNAVLAFKKEGYTWKDISIVDIMRTLSWPGFYVLSFNYFKVGVYEIFRSLCKPIFVKSLKNLIPEIASKDIYKAGSGVRAQAVYINGKLVDDFYIIKKSNYIHVLNCPSPAATASLAIGEKISEKIFN